MSTSLVADSREGRSVRFDVVVPCYNYGQYLIDAVESILTQDVDVRILIIDDASTDSTAEIGQGLAERDSRVTFRRHAANKGHIATYNEGIDWAAGDYFFLLSADDLLMPGALHRVATAFTSEPNLVMVYGRMLDFVDGVPIANVLARQVAVQSASENRIEYLADGSSDGTPVFRLDEAEPETLEVQSTVAFYRANTHHNRIPASGTVTRTDVQKRVGGYRPTLPHAGDYEMWLRIAAHGPAGYVPRLQVARRLHRSNMSAQYDWIGDILQRVEVVRELQRSCGSILPEGALQPLRARVAAEALRATTVAMAAGSSTGRQQLVEAAKAIDPFLTRRPEWGIYLFKVMVGPHLWDYVRGTLLARYLRSLVSA